MVLIYAGPKQETAMVATILLSKYKIPQYYIYNEISFSCRKRTYKY